MAAIFFWLFSALMLGFACAVVFNRNPVASALSLVVSFGGLAALFFMLDAYFIGTIQILVYAGAVMVLFLFIIMLLDMKVEERRRLNTGVTAAKRSAFAPTRLLRSLHFLRIGHRTEWCATTGRNFQIATVTAY